ncbi:hypothetical protein T03_13867 [Trichinella britovi]|uniref:Uncharacterized protein n=1 Tax=Trichinella britovi TaxID=45882 RepID=A0A0V1D255_TRIBR|nr:hypothetical protein T03_13867 [Trichinella britovi]
MSRYLGEKCEFDDQLFQKNNFKCKKRKTAELLEKLLENEIRHEENVLLQCIRHVCSTIINFPKSETTGRETNF